MQAGTLAHASIERRTVASSSRCPIPDDEKHALSSTANAVTDGSLLR